MTAWRAVNSESCYLANEPRELVGSNLKFSLGGVQKLPCSHY